MDKHTRYRVTKRLPFTKVRWTLCLAYFLVPCCLLFLIRVLEADQPSTLIPVEGKPKKIRLIGCTSQGKWRFEQNGKITSLEANDFIRWGHPASRLNGPLMYLTDGSCLVADQSFTRLQITEDEVRFDSSTVGDNRRLPLTHVEAIILKPHAKNRLRDLWMQPLRDATRKSDVVLLNNGDLLEGTVIALDDEVLQLLSGTEETLQIPRDNLKAILFQPELLERPVPIEQLLLIQLADGSSLRAASWRGQLANIEVRTAGEAESLAFKIPWPKDSVVQKPIVGLLPIGYSAVFLSDIEEAKYKHQPYLSLEWPFRRDRNVMGARLQTQNKLYEKGIGMHADAELIFKLQQSFKRFDGAVGIDDSAEGQGSVRFEVSVQPAGGDWRTAFTSGVLRGGDTPESFSIDLRGIDAIRLKTDHATGGAVADRANWLDARLQRVDD